MEGVMAIVIGEVEKEKVLCVKDLNNFPYGYKSSQSTWIILQIFHQRVLCLKKIMACKNRNIDWPRHLKPLRGPLWTTISLRPSYKDPDYNTRARIILIEASWYVSTLIMQS
jgi:hypothetical protein